MESENQSFNSCFPSDLNHDNGVRTDLFVDPKIQTLLSSFDICVAWFRFLLYLLQATPVQSRVVKAVKDPKIGAPFLADGFLVKRI